jgi:hypothetical protein
LLVDEELIRRLVADGPVDEEAIDFAECVE